MCDNNEEFRKRCKVVLDVLILKLKEKNYLISHKSKDFYNGQNQFYYYCEIDNGYTHVGIEIIVFNPSFNNGENIAEFKINPDTKCFGQIDYGSDKIYNSINDIVKYIIETVEFIPVKI